MSSPTAPDTAPASGVPSGSEDSGPASAPPTTVDPTANMHKANAAMRKALAEREKELEALKRSAMTEQEKAVAEAKAQGEALYRQRWATAMVTNAAIAALAGKGVAAPELALGAMNLSDVDVDPNTGTVDTNAITAKVEEVLARYPMLTSNSGPAAPTATGSDQRRVTAADLAPSKDDRAKTNDMLRWALGGGKQPT